MVGPLDFNVSPLDLGIRGLELGNRWEINDEAMFIYAEFLYFSLITIIAHLQTIISSHILRDFTMIPIGIWATNEDVERIKLFGLIGS